MRFLGSSRSYLIWGSAALFYVYQFVLRVSPGLMVDDLMISFKVDASQVAALAAMAMYSYSLLQIPAGILTDSLGARRVLLGSVLLCLIGVTLFAVASDLRWAKLGRLILGSGSAAAFLCVSKVSAQEFQPEKRARLLGLTMAMGTVGAYLGNVCLSVLIAQWGWRTSLLSTHLLGVSVLVLIFVLAPRQKAAHERESIRKVIQQLLWIVGMRRFWVYSTCALGIYLCISVLADLWGVPFLMSAYRVEKTVAVKMASLIYTGLCVGSLVLTTLSDLLRVRERLIQVSGLILFGLSISLVYWINLPLVVVSTLLFLIGFFAGAEMLCFASLCDGEAAGIAGTLTCLMNCVVMLGGAVMAEQVGRLLDTFWQGQFLEQGVRAYHLAEYQKSLALVVGVILISFVAGLLLTQKAEAQVLSRS